MKKIIIIILAVLALGAIGYYVTNSNDEMPDGMSADAEIQTLANAVITTEQELKELEVQVTNGTLTPTAAIAARAKLETRLETLTTAFSNSEKYSLTQIQREAMVATLDTIKNVLVRYQDTLVAVDTIAANDTSNSSSGKRGFVGSITKAFVKTVSDLQVEIQDTVRDYEPVEIVLDVETETHLEVAEAAEDQADMEAEARVVASSTTETELDMESTTTVETDMEATLDTETISETSDETVLEVQ